MRSVPFAWPDIGCDFGTLTDAHISCTNTHPHTNQTTYQAAALIFLKDITNITRTDLKPYCVEIETKDKTYYLQLKSDEELYGW